MSLAVLRSSHKERDCQRVSEELACTGDKLTPYAKVGPTFARLVSAPGIWVGASRTASATGGESPARTMPVWSLHELPRIPVMRSSPSLASDGSCYRVKTCLCSTANEIPTRYLNERRTNVGGFKGVPHWVSW